MTSEKVVIHDKVIAIKEKLDRLKQTEGLIRESEIEKMPLKLISMSFNVKSKIPKLA